jgi:hypothetical protein
MDDFTRKNINYRYKPYVQSRYFDRKLLKFWKNFYEGYGWKHNFKAPPGPAGRPGWPGAGTESGWWKNRSGIWSGKTRSIRWVNPGKPDWDPAILGRVDEKTGQEFGPVKPGRSSGSTRGNPTETRLCFLIYIYIYIYIYIVLDFFLLRIFVRS